MSKELLSKRQEIEAQMANHMCNLRKQLEGLQALLKEAQAAARAFSAMGDRSENAEWQIANDNVARYTVSIVSLMDTLDTYERYKTSYTETGKVCCGSTVKLIDKLRGATLYVKIYPAGIGNAKIGAITEATPVGRALIGKEAGTEVIVKAPLGEIPYYIEEVL